MNPYRTNSYDPGDPTPPPRWDQRRVPNWVSALVVGLAVALSAFPIAWAATSSLRLNGIRYPDGTGSPSGFFNAKSPEWGCIADGTTDDTPCFNAMATAAAVKGGTIYLPASNGERYTLTSTVVISSIYPVNIISDMNGFADNQTTGAFIHPGANFGATPMIKYIAPGGAHGAHGGGLIRGLAFYDNFDGTHTPHYTMSMALDLQDFNLGRIENCYFNVLNGGAIRSVYWVMGSMRNVVIRYCGVAAGQAALSLESFSSSVTAQSTTIDNVKLEVNYSTYLKLDSSVVQVKFAQLGFEADTSNALTCQTFVDNSGQQIQFSNVHMNRNTVTQWVNQAASNFTIADNFSLFGNASQTATSMTINGSNHIFRGITVRNFAAQTTYSITVTGIAIILDGVNIKSSGGIGVSGNAYVRVSNAIVDTPTSGAGTSAIDVSSDQSHVDNCLVKGLPANMNGIRLSGSIHASSVEHCYVRDQNGTGAAFVDASSNNTASWIGNNGSTNTTNFTQPGFSGILKGNAFAADSDGVAQAIAAATSLTITPISYNRITLSATAITSLTVSAGLDGQVAVFEIVEDATGTRTIPTTWTNVQFAGGTYTVTTTASKKDIIVLRYNGSLSKWLEQSRSLNI